MKTPKITSQDHGSVLLVTLVITGVLGITLASYLTMIGTQHRSVMRSQTWNASVPIAEAGIEEAMVHLNKNCLENDINPQPVNWNADGWLTVSNGVQMTRNLGENKYIVTIVTSPPYSQSKPAILSEGYVPALFSTRLSSVFFAAAGVEAQQTPQAQYVGRKIRVKTAKDGLMIGAMVAKKYIDFNGNGVQTDSYDSTDPAYSTDGRYDPSKRKDNGDVAVNYSIINGSLDVGNANILGSVAVGPGGTISIGPNGVVGDMEWHKSHQGIQPGRSRDDMNVSFPDVSVPFTGGYSEPTGTGRTVTNEVITTTSVTNTTAVHPGSGNIYTNTTLETTVSYPVSGTYIGSVVTNTVYTNTVAAPASGTYVGIVGTNTASSTTTNRPTEGTYLGSVITNAPIFTSMTYPTSPYGPVTTNMTRISNEKDYPAAGTYIGTVTTTYSPTRYAYNRFDGYSYRKITGYTVEKITSYGYHKIASYKVAKIVSYSLVSSLYETNYHPVYYDYVLDSGKYQVSSLSGKVLVLGEATLHVTSSLSAQEIEVAKDGRLKIYMGGSSFAVSGTKFINRSGDPDRLWYFGLPSNTSITVNGNGGFCGVIYAPQAHFALNGSGGSVINDFIGASLTKSVQMNGHFNFHYDESLANKGVSRGYLINAWDEVRLDETK